MNYDALIEKLMQFYTGEGNGEEVAAAKKDFFEMAGIFDEESDDFEMKLAQFTDWFLFTRKLSGPGLSPVHWALKDDRIKLTDAERAACELMSASRHSLFEFIKIKGRDVYIKDLFSDYKLVIKASVINVGFNREELFEARLIPLDDSYVFSSSFCLHPPRATKFILKEIKAVKKLPDEERDTAREKLIERLFRMRYKFEQYKHVELKDIYSNESKLNL